MKKEGVIGVKGLSPLENYFSTAFKYTFFYKNKVYEKNEAQMVKITRLNFQNLMSLLTKNKYFVVISFNMLKMEFKFKYKILITKA